MGRSRSRSPGRRDRHRSRSRSRDRDRDRERERRMRDRYRSRSRSGSPRRRRSRSPRRRSRSRSWSPPRRRSRSVSRGRERCKEAPRTAVPKFLMERPPITEKDLEGKTDEEREMMKLMGFGDFDTTKGKHVPGNIAYGVHIIQKRKYRQYMNRKGGFNRPLDFVA